jgi:hypothetical protein
MTLLLNPVFSICDGTDFLRRCGDTCVPMEAWVRKKRNPNPETYGPNQYANAFGGPLAPNAMATWMAIDENGAFYVLSRRKESSAMPWYVLAKFDACGNYITGIHINKDDGFGHYIDTTQNPQVCVGPQGVVVVAPPAYGGNGLIAGQAFPFHIVACFDSADLSLRWTLSTRVGPLTQPYTFNDFHGVFANQHTGHTYVFERYGGGGFDQGDCCMTTISSDGKLTGKALFGLPATGYFVPNINTVDSVIIRPGGSVLVFGTSSQVDTYEISQNIAFSWSIIFSANGNSVLREYVVSEVTTVAPKMTGLGGCVRSDGKILVASKAGGVFVLNPEATSILECWAGAWNGGRLNPSQMKTAPSGEIYWLSTGPGADVDLPASGWNGSQPFGAPTIRLRLLAPDGKTVLKSKSVRVGPSNLADYEPDWATPLGYAVDSIDANAGRAGMLVAGWGLTAFSLTGNSLSFDLGPAYTFSENPAEQGFAKFAKFTGGPFPISGNPFTPPSLSVAPLPGLLGATPTFLPVETADFYGLFAEESAADVVWEMFSKSEVS